MLLRIQRAMMNRKKMMLKSRKRRSKKTPGWIFLCQKDVSRSIQGFPSLSFATKLTYFNMATGRCCQSKIWTSSRNIFVNTASNMELVLYLLRQPHTETLMCFTSTSYTDSTILISFLNLKLQNAMDFFCQLVLTVQI